LGHVLRRALGALLVAGLLVTALAFYIYSPYLTLTAATGGTAASAGPATSVSPPAESPSPVASSTRAPSPTAPAPESHPSGHQTGIRLVATVRKGEVFDVTETVRLPAPVTELTLTPPDLRSAGRDLRAARPMVTGLAVRAGDHSVPLPRRTMQSATTVTLRQPADRFVVRYRLHGTIHLNKPSSAGRALGAVGPLVSGLPPELPVAASFPGAAVRNLRCAGLPVADQACIAAGRPPARVNQDLPLHAALVLVQLDLTRAR
jgi:hypothetical protein